MPKITVATANACYGQLTRSPNGLEVFADHKVDILNLQEVRDPEADHFTNQLERYNFTLIHAVGNAGLAMAINKESAAVLDPKSVHHESFRSMRPWEQRLYDRQSRLVGQFPERGLIAARFLVDESTVAVATTHPFPPTRTHSRNNQVRLIGQHLANPRYDENLVITGDWNHWPTARSNDLRMRQEAGLSTADIGSELTWSFQDMKMMKSLARCISMARYPTPKNIRSLGNQRLDAFGGQLDAILYRGPNLKLLNTAVVPIQSDHRALISTFSVK